jgi:hypothetical protein
MCPAPKKLYRSWTVSDVADVLAMIEPRMRRLIDRPGLGKGDKGASAPDEWAEDAPVLAGIAAASVEGTFALEPRQGARARRRGEPPEDGGQSARPEARRWADLMRRIFREPRERRSRLMFPMVSFPDPPLTSRER